MNLNSTVRKLHYWVSIVAALPASILIGSGLLLQTKKHWSWGSGLFLFWLPLAAKRRRRERSS